MRKSPLLLVAAAVMTAACTTVQDVPSVPAQPLISKPPVPLNEGTTLKANDVPAAFQAAPPAPAPTDEPPAVTVTPVTAPAAAQVRPLPLKKAKPAPVRRAAPAKAPKAS